MVIPHMPLFYLDTVKLFDHNHSSNQYERHHFYRHVPIPKLLGFGFWDLGQLWVWVIRVLGPFWVWGFAFWVVLGFGFRFFPQNMILIITKNTTVC
jgi:hypothetical protein